MGTVLLKAWSAVVIYGSPPVVEGRFFTEEDCKIAIQGDKRAVCHYGEFLVYEKEVESGVIGL